MLSDRDPLAMLQAAYADLEARRLTSVVERLQPAFDRLGVAAEALLFTARGLQLEEQGRIAEALRCMEHAFALDVALPSLLRELALFFQRQGRPVLAHHAYLSLDILDPQAAPPSPQALPASEWARHAPRYLRARLQAGQQLTYHVAPFKAALVESLGVEGASMVMAGISDGEGQRVAARRPLVALIDHARASGLEYAELIPVGLVDSHPPRVFGRPRGETFQKRTRALFTCVLEDVVVPSKSNFLLTRDAALLDVQGEELARRPDVGVDPLVVARDGDHVYVTEPLHRDALRSLPEAVWLTGVHAWGFGHWMMEFLPKVWALMERPGFGSVPILIDEGMPPQHVEALRLFVGPSQPIITLRRQEHVRVGRLWVASQIVYLAVGPRPDRPRGPGRRALDARGFVRLMGRAHAALAGIDSSGAPPRLYLTRKPSQHRRLTNATELEPLLVSHGFVPVDLGDLTFLEQLRLIRGAEHVVGQDGSSLLMTILAPPGLRIGVLSQPQLDECEWHADASEALGHELTVLAGRLVKEHPAYAWMSDYEIDPGQLEAYLTTIESRVASRAPGAEGSPPSPPRKLVAVPVEREPALSGVLDEGRE